MAIPMDISMMRNHPKVSEMVSLYGRNRCRDLVPRAVTSSILILGDELCDELLSSDAAATRESFSHFILEMEITNASYYHIKLQGDKDKRNPQRIHGCDQTKHERHIGDHYRTLSDQVQLILGVLEYYKRDDIPHDSNMRKLNEDKNTIRGIWKDCVYTNLKTIFLMKGYDSCTLPYKNAKTAIGSLLHKVLKSTTEQMENDATRQMENDKIEQMVNRISTQEEASRVSKKIEDAILLWKRKSLKSEIRMEPTKQKKYNTSIETAVNFLFELKYRFPSWEAKIGFKFVDLNLHVGLACIEAYSRAVEKLASKVNELIDARQTQG